MSNTNLLGNRKEKTVETRNLQIKGHLLQWEDVAIQISNISLVTSSDVQPSQFPVGVVVLIVLAFALIFFNVIFGLILLALAVLVCYLWYRENEKKKKLKFLHLQLNSGTTFSILFQSKEFLNEVLTVFSNIFEDGGKVSSEYYFDLKNCTITEGSSVVGTVNELGR